MRVVSCRFVMSATCANAWASRDPPRAVAGGSVTSRGHQRPSRRLASVVGRRDAIAHYTKQKLVSRSRGRNSFFEVVNSCDLFVSGILTLHEANARWENMVAHV